MALSSGSHVDIYGSVRFLFSVFPPRRHPCALRVLALQSSVSTLSFEGLGRSAAAVYVLSHVKGFLAGT